MKFIPGYENLYSITEDGKVWSHKLDRFINQHNMDGYMYVHLIKDDDKKYSVHRLMALTYLPNPDNKPTVDHINRNPLDNRIENLRWATSTEQNINKDNTYFESHHAELSQKGGDAVARAVEMRDKDNHDILYKTFASSTQAAIDEFNDIKKNSLINRCARGKVRQAYGYWWCFKSE